MRLFSNLTLTALATAFIASGCGAPPAPESTQLDPPAADAGFQLSTPKWSLQPGEERIMCLFTTLPGDGEDIWLDRIEMAMAPGSHHFLIYRDISDLVGAEWQPGWRECEMQGSALPFTGTQRESEEQLYPEGVAYKLEGGQRVVLESHYINYTDEPMEAQATANFYFTDVAQVEQQAASYLTYKQNYDVPVGAGIGSNPDHVEDLVCPVPEREEGVHFFTLSSHMHWHGRQFDAWTHDMSTGEDIDHIYTNTDWSDPDIEQLDSSEELTLLPGEGFRYQCSYFNDTGHVVSEGPSADDEMCMLIGNYYPAVNGPLGLDGISLCLDGDLYY